MTKFLISLLAFLLFLFPHSTSLLSINQQLTNSTNVAAPKIMNAIETGDVAALEALMCLNIKQNVKNLPEKINELLDAIDGEIIEASWVHSGGSYSGNRENGKTINQSGVDVLITTTTGTYVVGVWWETINTFQPEETGIRSIGLAQTNPLKTLAILRATEGVESWHD